MAEAGVLKNEEWVSTMLAKAPAIVAALLAIVIGLQLTTIVFSFFGSSTAPIAAATNDPASSNRQAAKPVNAAAIVNAHLFGVADAKDEPEPEVQAEVVGVTNLNLKLKGTIAATEEGAARAIIADASNKETVYAIKDTISRGVTLHAVERERVILNQSGRLTALELPKEFKSGGATTRVANSNSVRASAPTPPAGASSSIRETLTQNAASLTDVIRPQPYFSGGQQKGYRIYPGRDRKQFADLGLRPGDLVTAINGTPMTDPRQGMQVFRSLGDATSVTVTLERNGQPQTLTLSTSQINQ